jgi:hypothetical protein
MRVLSERGNRKLVEPEVLDLLHLGVQEASKARSVNSITNTATRNPA